MRLWRAIHALVAGLGCELRSAAFDAVFLAAGFAIWGLSRPFAWLLW